VPSQGYQAGEVVRVARGNHSARLGNDSELVLVPGADCRRLLAGIPFGRTIGPPPGFSCYPSDTRACSAIINTSNARHGFAR
jgi:hypothetical protein